MKLQTTLLLFSQLALQPFHEVQAFLVSNPSRIAQHAVSNGFPSISPITRRHDTSLGIEMRNNGSNNRPTYYEEPKLDTEDFLVILLPAILTALAFEFYDETNTAFHKLVDFASSNSWQAVDGGAYLSDLLIPALNGPIVTFISLLFGSLSSMTLSNLYTRQVALANNFAKFVEDVRLLDLHLSYLPTEYQRKSKYSLRRYTAQARRMFRVGVSKEELQLERELRREEIEDIMMVLHDLSEDSSIQVSGRVMDEAYGSLNRIIDRRSDMLTIYDQQFPLWYVHHLCGKLPRILLPCNESHCVSLPLCSQALWQSGASCYRHLHCLFHHHGSISPHLFGGLSASNLLGHPSWDDICTVLCHL